MASMKTYDKVRRVLRHLSSILDTQPSRGSRVSEKKYLLKQTESKKYQIETLKQQGSSTIYDFFASAVEDLPPIVPKQQDESFHLQEDIIMMIELSSYTVFNDQAFEYLSKLKSLKRSIYSIAERHEKHMARLGEEDIDQMCKWIEKFGVNGFARFQGDLFIISLLDQAKNKSITVQTQDESKEINDERETEKKGIKYSNIKKGMFDDLEDLQKILNIYSAMVHKPISFLLKILNQTSGDFCDLDHYLQTGDKRVLWTQQQDKILHFQVSDKSELSSYRSTQSINKRRRYLDIF